MIFTPRTITDQDVEFPNRYNLLDTVSGTIVDTVDIVPTWKSNPSEVIQTGAEIDSNYLQPVEDFLGYTSSVLNAFDFTEFAPIINAELVNPSANTPAQSDNSTRLATTEWMRTYFTALMAAYTGG